MIDYLKRECQQKTLMQYFENKAKLNKLRTKIKSKKKRNYRLVKVSKRISIIYFEENENEKQRTV